MTDKRRNAGIQHGELIEIRHAARSRRWDEPSGIRGTEESPSGATTIGRRPYKCPCCDGYGKREGRRVAKIIFEPCCTCDGTGVVWG